MTISVAIMAHPKRAPFVEALQDELDLDDTHVVWDRHNDRHETGLRSLQAYDPDATHHLVIQDDAVAAPHLLEALEEITSHQPDNPIGLYVGSARARTEYARVPDHFNAARAQGRTLLRMLGPLRGVAICFPTVHLTELTTSYAANPRTKNYDRRISRWYMTVATRDTLYTVPSLVNHRPVAENPSLIEGRTGNRQAHWFCGDRSALEFDWSIEPWVARGEPGKRPPAEPRHLISFQHRSGGRRNAWEASSVARRLDLHPDWERA